MKSVQASNRDGIKTSLVTLNAISTCMKIAKIVLVTPRVKSQSHLFKRRKDSKWKYREARLISPRSQSPLFLDFPAFRSHLFRAQLTTSKARWLLTYPPRASAARRRGRICLLPSSLSESSPRFLHIFLRYNRAPLPRQSIRVLPWPYRNLHIFAILSGVEGFIYGSVGAFERVLFLASRGDAAGIRGLSIRRETGSGL